MKPNNPFHSLSLLSTFTIPLIFIVFWLHHARIFAGDGRLIARLVEDGKWFVTNELFSQAILQTLYTALRHWSITPLEIMNLFSTVCGTVALALLARFGHRYQVSFSWSLILFLSSGFFIYACGHTEYYPMLLPVLFWYGHASCDYLANAGSYKKAGFVFLLGCSLHLAMLIALPSLLLLPILRKRVNDMSALLWPGVLLLTLLLLRNHAGLFGFHTSSISSGWHGLPLFASDAAGLHYPFFAWSHLMDWLYGLSWRSWIFLPVLCWLAIRSPQSLRRPDRLFLAVYMLCFTAWTWIWHPDLGMPNDWDLFAIEAAPALLLVLTYIPDIQKSTVYKTGLLLILVASIFMNHGFIIKQADYPIRHTGSATIHIDEGSSYNLTINERYKETVYPRLREGPHHGKFIDTTHRYMLDFYFHVIPKHHTHVNIDQKGMKRNQPGER